MTPPDHDDTAPHAVASADEHAGLQTLFLGVLAGLAVSFILATTSAFTIPLAISILLVVVLAPAQDWLVARGLPRPLANLLLLIALLLLLTGLGALFYDAVRSVSQGADLYIERAAAQLRALNDSLETRFDFTLTHASTAESAPLLPRLFASNSAMSTVNAGLGSIRQLLSSAVVTFILTMFILGSRAAMTRKMRHFLGDRGFSEQSSDEILTSVSGQIRGYLGLKTIISLLTGVAVWLVAVLCGLDFALVWGFLTVVLNFIPVIGPIIASLPAIAVAFLQFGSPGWALFVSLLIAGVQFASSNIIEPKLMGDRFDLNIVVVLMSLFTWGLIWGFAGMVLSIPLTATINIVLANTRRFRSVSVWLSK